MPVEDVLLDDIARDIAQASPWTTEVHQNGGVRPSNEDVVRLRVIAARIVKNSTVQRRTNYVTMNRDPSFTSI